MLCFFGVEDEEDVDVRICVTRTEQCDNVGQYHTGENSSNRKERRLNINDDDDDSERRKKERFSLKKISSKMLSHVNAKRKYRVLVWLLSLLVGRSLKQL